MDGQTKYVNQTLEQYLRYFYDYQQAVRGGADCTALPRGNGLYCKLKLKREEELTTRSKYLNKYGER